MAMSLFSASILNTAVAYIAKKSAAFAALSGAVLSSIGILLAAHGIMLWNHGNTVSQENQNTRQILLQKRMRLQNMEAMILRKERQQRKSTKATACTKIVSLSCKPTVHAYHTLYKTIRAVRMDLPNWAAENDIQLSVLENPVGITHAPGTQNSGQPVPGYPGISQFIFHLTGTYTDLKQLQNFFRSMPTGIELTGIRIQNDRFTAEITAYGLDS
ncbi:hypothetical protein [Acidithiobacillus caldus]|nr:hypothetical protein [Acidithiobacillus caldus]